MVPPFANRPMLVLVIRAGSSKKIPSYLASIKSYWRSMFGCGAAVVVIAWLTTLFAIPSVPSFDLGLFRQLNQELGALCQAPPAQAVKVCRFHARLVRH